MPEIAACKTNELAPDEICEVQVEGRKSIAVYNLDGDFFATDDTCTHGDASLAEGDIEDGEVICPFHMGAFDIRTGEATAPPCVSPIRVYPVRIERDIVYVKLDE
jgi:nitrite reductase/ring-hydroxylating ferredoxin subunit